MLFHPQVTHLNGVVSLSFVVNFIGDATDIEDRERISSYGEPQVNLGGVFANGTAFQFRTGASEAWVKVINEMPQKTIRFMTQLPSTGNTTPGPLDVLTADPILAATIYAQQIQARVLTVMVELRQKVPAKFASLPDATI